MYLKKKINIQFLLKSHLRRQKQAAWSWLIGARCAWFGTTFATLAFRSCATWPLFLGASTKCQSWSGTHWAICVSKIRKNVSNCEVSCILEKYLHIDGNVLNIWATAFIYDDEDKMWRQAGFVEMLVSPAKRDQNEMGGLQKRGRFKTFLNESKTRSLMMKTRSLMMKKCRNLKKRD